MVVAVAAVDAAVAVVGGIACPQTAAGVWRLPWRVGASDRKGGSGVASLHPCVGEGAGGREAERTRSDLGQT